MSIDNSSGICEIPLNKGMVAIVDAQDVEALSQFHWYAHPGRYCWYAVSHYRPERKGKRYSIAMHRYICELRGIDISGIQIDHKDRNGLNNRFLNLRIAAHSQNSINQQKRKDNSSGYKGVHFHAPKYGKPRWRARLQVEGRRLHLGCFESKEDAALAYNEAAIKYFGEFAVLNELPREEA